MASGKSRNSFYSFRIKGRNKGILISAFFVFLVTALCSCGHKAQGTLFQLPEEWELRSGDLVFRKGGSLISHTVTFADTGSVYSHVGMVLWTPEGWKVLHAVPNERASKHEKDSVKLENIEIFFRSDRASHGAVYRLNPSPVSYDTLKLRQKGLEIYQRHLLFDGSFDDLDSNAFYCTELVWFIYQKELGIDLSEGRRHKEPLFPPMIFCSDILAYPELKEIYKF